MEKLNHLVRTLNAVKNLTSQILGKAVPILETLGSKDETLLDEFLDENDGIDRETAASVLQTISLGLVKDAETIIQEMEKFSDVVIQGEDALSENQDDYPFLMQVWCGDMYGEMGTEGFQHLIRDLREQLANVDEDKIFELALSKLGVEE